MKPRTAFDETLHRLENAIKLGLLEPGSRLPAERELCTRLGISRSTLRQALMTLTRSGYLHATRGRGGGTFVVDFPPVSSPLSAKKAAGWSDACDERLAIELGVVSLAATRATPATIEPLKQLATALERCVDEPLLYCQLDRQLHVAIAKVTGSSRLTIASTRMQALIFELMSSLAPSPEQRERSDMGHRAIIDALMAADEEAAIRAMSAHLDETRTLLKTALAGQGSATMASTAT